VKSSIAVTEFATAAVYKFTIAWIDANRCDCGFLRISESGNRAAPRDYASVEEFLVAEPP
jgi:hypothetical protein